MTMLGASLVFEALNIFCWKSGDERSNPFLELFVIEVYKITCRKHSVVDRKKGRIKNEIKENYISKKNCSFKL